jgi:succinate-semialdehyde dehydrogenase/glutarate-semialdehyde dehydrogenase
MTIASTNPATGQVVRTFEPFTAAQIDERLQRASDSLGPLLSATVARRAEWMRRAAQILQADTDQLALTMTLEMGKTLAQAKAEVAKSVRACRFYAEHAQDFLADEPADAEAVGAAQAYVRYEPIGVVLAVMPWNFPLWQAMRFAIPALMAGNAGLLKHASNVPQTALYIGDLFSRAGFPPGSFQTLLIESVQVESVIRDPRVAAATLTGSEAAGRAVSRIAAEELKKVVLELGGSDPFVVMPSADLERAATVAVAARCQNNGQSCIAAKRFVVHADVYDAFAGLFAEKMRSLRVGHPTDPGTEVGPLATQQGLAELEELVTEAVSKGAKVVCGGERLPEPGWFYPPTVLTGITPSMRLFSEEAFGPVAGLYRVESFAEAIKLANATRFGLGASIWTEDAAERDQAIATLASGLVFVNGMVASYPELPFGGIKASGHGRELSVNGIREFCNVKTVWVGAGRILTAR